MNIVEKRLSELIPYKNNPKIHTDEQIAQIARSIELTKGLRQPIVIDANNVIVAGHGRFLAAKKLGLETVPCEMVDDLTEDEIRAYRLIDNRIASGEYDVDLELEELESIDLDLADFGFDYSLDEDDYDDYDIGIDKKENARPMQSDAFENQELMQFDATSYYGIPDLRPTQITGDKFIRFCDWHECERPEEYIAHFYYDDYKFMAAWRDPNRFLPRLQAFKAVVAPNFSLYTDFPRALQILSCYRRNWCGAYWSYFGVNIIPQVCWGDRESYDYCFDGLPKRSTVSISTVGVKRDKEWNGSVDSRFKDGWNEMMNRIEPTTVLYYGDMIDGLEGNIIRIPSFYEQRREYLNQKAKEKRDAENSNKID